MDQQKLVGLGWSKSPFGPFAEGTLDGPFHFREETHG
jgi:hypothetical protein